MNAYARMHFKDLYSGNFQISMDSSRAAYSYLAFLVSYGFKEKCNVCMFVCMYFSTMFTASC